MKMIIAIVQDDDALDLVDECTGACRVCKNKECIMKHQ